jgi:nitroimidazol reductase NimA-like FMN-containing flavoprotein (pyridoxamine 5'-phosphate oxidase superfamily)
MESHEAKDLVRKLFSTQNYGVLATQHDGHPYTTLVAFVATDDHRSLLFVTKSSTSKYVHIKHNPYISLLIDNRQNNPKDIKHATVVTVLGEAKEISTPNKKKYVAVYLSKHPHLESFLKAPTSVLIELIIKKIIIVTKFQQIVEWNIES